MEPIPTDLADTRTALLDAAEELFAQQGADCTSLREITRRAGANLAAVNYHFGSKEALVHAVLARHLGPLNAERLRRLDRAVADPNEPPETEEIVRAFVTPALEMVRQEPRGHAFARFVVHAFTDPRRGLRSEVLGQFREVIQRFTEALARALPELPEDEIYWRFHFMVGAMAHTVGLGHLVESYSGGICNPRDVEALIARLVAFIEGGLQQPAAESGEPT